MTPRLKTIRLLEQAGFCLKRHGANHDIYYHPLTKTTIPVKRHDFNNNDMNYILKEAGLDSDTKPKKTRRKEDR